MGWNKVLCPALTEAIAEYSASATAKNFTNTYLPLYDTCPMLCVTGVTVNRDVHFVASIQR